MNFALELNIKICRNKTNKHPENIRSVLIYYVVTGKTNINVPINGHPAHNKDYAQHYTSVILTGSTNLPAFMQDLYGISKTNGII